MPKAMEQPSLPKDGDASKKELQDVQPADHEEQPMDTSTPNMCYFLMLPNELIDMCLDSIGPTYAKLAARATCRRLSQYKPASVTRKDVWMLKQVLNLAECIPAEQRYPAFAACGGCCTMHSISAFTPHMMERDPRLRRCKGREGWFSLGMGRGYPYDKIRKMLAGLVPRDRLSPWEQETTVSIVLRPGAQNTWHLCRLVHIESKPAKNFGEGFDGFIFDEKVSGIRVCAHLTLTIDHVSLDTF